MIGNCSPGARVVVVGAVVPVTDVPGFAPPVSGSSVGTVVVVVGVVEVNVGATVEVGGGTIVDVSDGAGGTYTGEFSFSVGSNRTAFQSSRISRNATTMTTVVVRKPPGR